jgi:hypothetical protein
VRDFLNHLIGAPSSDPAVEFVESALSEPLTTDPQKLKQFLDGHIFMTHFIRAGDTMRIQDLAVAWCRGAAIMTAPANPSIDHIIPVLMPQADVSEFGPVFGEWNNAQIDAARRYMSYILIDSKNYAKPTTWTVVAHNLRPIDLSNGNKTQQTNLIGSHPLHNVYMAVVQNFGDRETQPAVEVGPVQSRQSNRKKVDSKPNLHFSVILNGINPETYCVLFPPNGSSTSNAGESFGETKPYSNPREILRHGSNEDILDRRGAQEALKDMRYLQVPYIIYDESLRKNKQPWFAVDSLPLRHVLPGQTILKIGKKSDSDCWRSNTISSELRISI